MMDFIGIGVHRSGTTWSWRQLVSHPEICTTPKEACNYLPENPEKTQFRKSRNLPECYGKCKGLRGEWTPAYFTSPTALQRIAKYSPNAKLLLLLRNPVDRIVTQFKVTQWIRHGYVRDDFTRWFVNPRQRQRTPLYVRSPHQANVYVEFARPWIRTFGERLMISLYDDLVADPLKYIQGCFRHIGVDDSFVPPNHMQRDVKEYNLYFEKNPYRIDENQRTMLKSYYRDSILELQDLLGRDLSGWLK